MENYFIGILDHIVKYGLPIVAMFISWRAFENSKKLENEKSRLKKIEILFNLQIKAVQEFNRIYQMQNPTNLAYAGNEDIIVSAMRKINIRKKLEEFQGKYGYIFENEKDIKHSINSIFRSLESLEEYEMNNNSGINDGSDLEYYGNISLSFNDAYNKINSFFYNALKK